MSIRTLRPGEKWPPTRNRRKADQHWDMAGLARQDGDRANEARQTALAREFERRCAEENE